MGFLKANLLRSPTKSSMSHVDRKGNCTSNLLQSHSDKTHPLTVLVNKKYIIGLLIKLNKTYNQPYDIATLDTYFKTWKDLMTHTALQTVIVAVVFGVAATLLGRLLRIPAILFYLILGVALGPLGVHWIRVESLGHGLVVMVEIMVAVILFEGGLSLSTHSFRKTGTAIRRMLLISIPLTGLGAACFSYSILNLPWPKALFFGALIVVTGPTVVGSLLKAVSLNGHLRSLLNWESI